MRRDRGLELEHPGVALHAQPTKQHPVPWLHGATERRSRAARERELCLDVEVDARRFTTGAGLDHGGLVSRDGADPVQAIAAEIHERTAAQRFDVTQLARRVR